MKTRAISMAAEDKLRALVATMGADGRISMEAAGELIRGIESFRFLPETGDPGDYLRPKAAALYYYKLTRERVPTHSTVINWITNGKIGSNGRICKLRGARRGKKGKLWVTRRAWVEEFVANLKGDR